MQLDKELWTRIANDDQQAFADMFRIFYPRLYNYGKKFTEDATVIEDMIQETLLSIWVKRKTLSSIDYPLTYYFTTFRNALIQKLKTEQRFVGDSSEGEEPEFAIDQILIRKEIEESKRESLSQALLALTSRQREAIFLRFYEGLPYEEVAGMLNITVKATYKIIARALEELRQGLGEPRCLVFMLLLSGAL